MNAPVLRNPSRLLCRPVSIRPGPIVASTAVTLNETWQPAADNFHVCDAVTRVLDRSAAGVPGLALAALDFPAPQGVRAYVDAPTVNDQVERGEVTGRRTDRVTYVFA